MNVLQLLIGPEILIIALILIVPVAFVFIGLLLFQGFQSFWSGLNDE